MRESYPRILGSSTSATVELDDGTVAYCFTEATVAYKVAVSPDQNVDIVVQRDTVNSEPEKELNARILARAQSLADTGGKAERIY